MNTDVLGPNAKQIVKDFHALRLALEDVRPVLSLYRLGLSFTANHPWDCIQDTMSQLIVAAHTPLEARSLAARLALDEGPTAWEDTTLSRCERIGLAASHHKHPRMVMREVIWA